MSSIRYRAARAVYPAKCVLFNEVRLITRCKNVLIHPDDQIAFTSVYPWSEGVGRNDTSMERVSFQRATQDATNWAGMKERACDSLPLLLWLK